MTKIHEKIIKAHEALVLFEKLDENGEIIPILREALRESNESILLHRIMDFIMHHSPKTEDIIQVDRGSFEIIYAMMRPHIMGDHNA